MTERELRFEEALAGRPIASAKMGETLDGHLRLHRPGLVVSVDGGYVVYEVELTPKSRSRLKAIPTRAESGRSAGTKPVSV